MRSVINICRFKLPHTFAAYYFATMHIYCKYNLHNPHRINKEYSIMHAKYSIFMVTIVITILSLQEKSLI